MTCQDQSKTFVLRVPWGMFGPGAEWAPNPMMKMTEDQQRLENVENGYLPAQQNTN